ncbi:hypothetical protein UPYG_G00002890 [Umbra pygmaea]|uniref:TRAF3-interacting JNK-activating modulator n=1 Tax=Umbra pygmaea TaxID=75934 RepID=A0ABD0XH12_UMBPY
METQDVTSTQWTKARVYEQTSEQRAEKHRGLRCRNNSSSCRSPNRELDTRWIKQELKRKRQHEFHRRRSLSPERANKPEKDNSCVICDTANSERLVAKLTGNPRSNLPGSGQANNSVKVKVKDEVICHESLQSNVTWTLTPRPTINERPLILARRTVTNKEVLTEVDTSEWAATWIDQTPIKKNKKKKSRKLEALFSNVTSSTSSTSTPNREEAISMTTTSTLTPLTTTSTPNREEAISMTTTSNLTPLTTTSTPNREEAISMTTTSTLTPLTTTSTPNREEAISMTTTSNLAPLTTTSTANTEEAISMTTTSTLTPLTTTSTPNRKSPTSMTTTSKLTPLTTTSTPNRVPSTSNTTSAKTSTSTFTSIDRVQASLKATTRTGKGILMCTDESSKKTRQETSSQTEPGFVTVKESEVILLADYLQEALRREEGLKRKLSVLQNSSSALLHHTDKLWTTCCNEDLLKTQNKALESQLQICLQKQTLPGDGVKKLMLQMEEHKGVYEGNALEAIQRATHEKNSALSQTQALEMLLQEARLETAQWQGLYEEMKERSDLQKKIQEASADQVLQLQNQLERVQGREAELKGELHAMQLVEEELHSIMAILEEQNQSLTQEVQKMKDTRPMTQDVSLTQPLAQPDMTSELEGLKLKLVLLEEPKEEPEKDVDYIEEDEEDEEEEEKEEEVSSQQEQLSWRGGVENEEQLSWRGGGEKEEQLSWRGGGEVEEELSWRGGVEVEEQLSWIGGSEKEEQLSWIGGGEVEEELSWRGGGEKEEQLSWIGGGEKEEQLSWIGGGEKQEQLSWRGGGEVEDQLSWRGGGEVGEKQSWRGGGEVEDQLRHTQERLRLKESECEELQSELEAVEAEYQSCQVRLRHCRDELRLINQRHSSKKPCVSWVHFLLLLLLLTVVVAAILWAWHPSFRHQAQELYSAAVEHIETYLVQAASAQHSDCFRPI